MPEKMTDRIIASAHFIAEFVEEEPIKSGWIFQTVMPEHWEIHPILKTTDDRLATCEWKVLSANDAFAVMAAFEKALLFEPNDIAMVPAK